MTTLSSSTPYSMASTTAMRATFTELLGWITSVGLVQTADTGQMDLTTATLPAGGATVIGYWIFRFADSSIFLKMELGTGTNQVYSPNCWLTVGTGSDGAGNITGQTSTRTQVTQNTAGTSQQQNSTTTAYPTYICRTADFFGICWKVGGPAQMPSAMAFAIEKTVDSSGAAVGTGFCVSYPGNALAANQVKQAVCTASPKTFTATSSFCAVPGNVTSSINSAGNKQSYLHQFPMPDVYLSNFLFTYVSSEASSSTTIQSTLVGATQHTYIALGNAMGTGNSSSASTVWGTMMLWE